jgi:hypothetical protein
MVHSLCINSIKYLLNTIHDTIQEQCYLSSNDEGDERESLAGSHAKPR